MKERTDKPKFKGSFVGHRVAQSIVKSSRVRYMDQKTGEFRYGKVESKGQTHWVWDGKDWVTERQFSPGPTTIEEWIAKGNRIKKY